MKRGNKHSYWGLAWLKALEGMDNYYFLRRGKSSVSINSVVSISVYSHHISARVQDARKTPYSTNVVMPIMAEDQKVLLVEKIKENNLLILRLLNKEMPIEVFQIVQDYELKLLPISFREISANCNCKERHLPCKHIAATLHAVTKEIDADPFLFFKLFGFDILQELRTRKVIFGYQHNEHIFSIRDCASVTWRYTYTPYGAPIHIVPKYVAIDNLLTTIPELFVARTSFYSGDFKPSISLIYKKASKEVLTADAALKELVQPELDLFRHVEYSLIFFHDHSMVIETKRGRERLVINWEQLKTLFVKTDAKHLDNYSASYTALYRIFIYCKILLEKGAILPRLYNCLDEGYKMLWIPAMLNGGVKANYDNLVECLPYGVLQLANSSTNSTRRGYDNRVPPIKAKPAEKSEGMMLLCSYIINATIENTYKTNRLSKITKKDDRKIADLFFSNHIIYFNTAGERNTPNAIQVWLKRFYFSEKHFIPLLQVTETNNKEGFEVSILVQHNKTELKENEPLELFLEAHEDEDRMVMLKDLNMLGEYYPDLAKLIETGGKEKLLYAADKFADVLLKILPVLDLFGIKALLPKSLQSIMRPMVTLKLTSARSKKNYFSLDGLMDYNWQVAMGDSFISQEEFERLSKTTMGLVRIRDQYILMDEAQVKKIILHLHKPAKLTGIELLQAALSGDYEKAPVFMDDKLKEQISNLLKDEEIPLPANLLATMRPYQQRGFNWIYKNSKLGIGSLLADDMGLGKTLQVIAAILKFKEEGLLKNAPALVIVPTTLLTNWMVEMKRFAPDIRALIFHGQGRTFDLENIDVVVTTYGIARTENEMFCKQKWYMVVVDEAQNIKNPDIAQTKSIKKIKGHIKVAMSGTPVENRLSEYWSIFDFANPNYLGSINWFESNYAKPIELYRDVVKLDKFKAITSPFIMRRMKTDKNIITDLPDKIESNQFCTLTKEQAALYQNLTHDLMRQIEQSDGMHRRGMVLKLLTVLKQICNHPANYLKNAEQHPALSGKTLLLLQLLETIYENNEKVIIFSQYQEMGTILKQIIQNHFGKTALQLHGGSSRNERDDMVADFQTNHLTDTFILSLKAGGTGLNLTAAANVIHYDLWWNPAVEAQATDRAFRIGQNQNVMVHRMITKGTLEEKIDEMLRSKRDLANMTIAHGETWVGELTDKELNELISFGEQ